MARQAHGRFVQLKSKSDIKTPNVSVAVVSWRPAEAVTRAARPAPNDRTISVAKATNGTVADMPAAFRTSFRPAPPSTLESRFRLKQAATMVNIALIPRHRPPKLV